MASNIPTYNINEETPTPFSSSSSPSHSSSDSSSSFSDSPFSSITPPLKFKGIPFSWEEIPGIPKNHQEFKRKEYSGRHLLPLPPSSGNNKEVISPKKYSTSSSNRFQKDPFLAALVECSKDDDTNILKGNSNKVSSRFGFINIMSSCKRTSCAVSGSIVYLPGPWPQHYRRS